MENEATITDKLSSAIEDLFEALDIDIDEYTIMNGTIRGPACCHGGDNPTAFTYYYLSGNWVCWTHSCHKKYGHNPIGLIMATKQVNVKDAMRFAHSFLEGKDLPFLGNFKHKKIAKQIKKIDEWEEHLKQPEQKEVMLTNSAFAYSKIRQLDHKLFNEMGISYVKNGTLRMRIVVPVKNIEGKIIGYTGRKAYDNLPGPKWLHYKLNTRNNLFNINKAAKAANKKGYIILCEGPWDVIKFRMAGYENAVAIFGVNLCNGHIKILNKCGIPKVGLALDNDPPGRKAALSMSRKLDNYLFDVHLIKAEKDSDFGKMSVQKIKEAVRKSGVER